MTADWSPAEWSGWMDESSAREHREMLDELRAADQKDTEQLLEQLGIESE